MLVKVGMRSAIKFALVSLSLTACAPVTLPSMSKLMPSQVQGPAMGWDHRVEASDWTARSLAAVASHDSELASRVPDDIAAFCPRYAKASLADRRAFWSGILSAVAQYESSWNPSASGGGGRYIGVMQISPKSAAAHGCSARSSAALKDGGANLECAVTMTALQVGRDNLVAGPKGNRGIGRDWMPLHNAAKRKAIATWVSKQSYCSE